MSYGYSKERTPLQMKLAPPDISGDAAALAEIAVRHCLLPHPDVVRSMDGAVFSVVRGRNAQHFEIVTIAGRGIMYDDNPSPRWALLWSHGFNEAAQGWICAHVWDNPKDPAAYADLANAYTHVANLLMMPESFGNLSDKQGPLVRHLRYHAQEVYGWWPAGKDPVGKPCGYDDLEWTYFNSFEDPRGFICKQLAKTQGKRRVVLRNLLNWYK